MSVFEQETCCVQTFNVLEYIKNNFCLKLKKLCELLEVREMIHEIGKSIEEKDP